MGKLESTIKSEIMRLAKRQVRTTFIPLKREVRQMISKLSGLSKGIASLNRMAKESAAGGRQAKTGSDPR